LSPLVHHACIALLLALASIPAFAQNAEQSVNYNTCALGREGYISLNLVTDPASIARDKSAAHELLGALSHNEGKRYADFYSSTDKVAEYGLAALIGGIAAKKLGLFAMFAAFLFKFWKIGLIALAGLGAVAPKLFKRRKGPNGPPALSVKRAEERRC